MMDEQDWYRLYAGLAMQSIIEGPMDDRLSARIERCGDHHVPEAIANFAFEMADAMMVESKDRISSAELLRVIDRPDNDDAQEDRT